MKKTVFIFTIASIIFFASHSVAQGFWDSSPSPSGFGNDGTSAPSSTSGGGISIGVDYNQFMRDFDAFMQKAKIQFESYEIPMWIKELEVKNRGKNSPFYDEVMSKN
jgi:hypothetical protein